MLIKEYRVTLPLTVEEYQVGQLYSVAEASKNNTGGGEGIEVLKNEPFDNHPLLGGKYTKGQYTYKIYHLASKVPSFIRYLAPRGSLEIHEEAWNAYPYCKTVITNPGYMKDNFVICIESLHLPDRGGQNNVHELPPEKLRQRDIVFIDIASSDAVSASDYKSDEDPTKFRSEKTGRGPLINCTSDSNSVTGNASYKQTGNAKTGADKNPAFTSGDWRNEVVPVMTCYKLVYAEFKWFGLQNKVEQFIHKSEKRLFTNFHRQVFCWIDRWHSLSMDDIRAIEDRTKRELEQLRVKGEVRGMRMENE